MTTTDPTTGTLLQDRYRLDAELGRGGAGVVYRGYDTLLQRPVAVKVLSGSSLGSQGRARLLHEARAAAQLKHPNIVGIFDAGETGELPYIVMELIEGHSLFDHRPASLPELLSIARQICDALHHAHAHGIVHRDLKLENVIVGLEGHATLTDFGLARSQVSRLSTEGGIVGTIFYLPPEQILGGEIDGRADLYALGVMLYELTTGRLPFTADEPLAVISQHLHAPVVPPSTFNADIPPDLDALIVRLMSKLSADRPASAADVRSILDRIAAPEQNLFDAGVPEEASPLDRLARGRLVSREREMAEVRSLWGQVVASQADRHVLLVSGEAGVGKTPFVREITVLAQLSSAHVLNTVCYAEGNAPYGPVAQLVHDALDLLTDAPRLPNPILADLATLAPDLRERYVGVPSNPALDPQAEQQRLFESILALCTALSADIPGAQTSNIASQRGGSHPLLLVMEDVQWADAGSLFLVRHLARRCRAARLKLLIVLTYREAEAGDACCLSEVILDLNRERLATHLRLARFDRDQTDHLLQSMFQQPVPSEFLNGIYRETEGNFFFIEEICKTLVEAGQLYRSGESWHWPAMDQIQLPDSVRATVEARVAKLPESAQDLLRLAAVIGQEFDFDTLQLAADGMGALPLDEEQLITAMELAERAQLIHEVRGKGSETFAFAHSLVRTTLRESVSVLRRRRMHRRVLAALEALHPNDFEMLAYHAEQAGEASRAATYYARAAERALAVYANQEAEHYLRSALSQATADAERAPLLAALGEAEFRQGEYGPANEAWEQATVLYHAAGNQDEVARLYARRGRCTWYAAGAARSLAVAQEGLRVVQAMTGSDVHPETPGMAALLHEVGRAYRFNDLDSAALPYCQEALAIAQRLKLVEIQADTLATLGILASQPVAVRQQALTQSVALAESAGLLITAIRAHENLADHLRWVGDLNGARSHTQRAREVAQRLGVPGWEYYQARRLADILLDLGDIARAEDAAAVMARLESRVSFPHPWELQRPLLEARIQRFRGELGEAARLLGELRAEAQPYYKSDLVAQIDYPLGDVLLELGRYAEAEAVLREGLELRAGELPYPRVWPHCLLCAGYAAQGHLDAANETFDEAHGLVETRRSAGDEVMLVWAEAQIAAASRDWDGAQVAYSDVAQRLRALGARWYLARILLQWANMRSRIPGTPNPSEGIELKRQAHAIFEELKIPYYAQIAGTRLGQPF